MPNLTCCSIGFGKTDLVSRRSIPHVEEPSCVFYSGFSCEVKAGVVFFEDDLEGVSGVCRGAVGGGEESEEQASIDVGFGGGEDEAVGGGGFVGLEGVVWAFVGVCEELTGNGDRHGRSCVDTLSWTVLCGWVSCNQGKLSFRAKTGILPLDARCSMCLWH